MPNGFSNFPVVKVSGRERGGGTGWGGGLNPLDYFLWSEVPRRMAEQKPQSNETEVAFKTRLRATAMGIPKSTIKAAVSKMKGKAAEVVAAEGGRIKSD